MKRRKNYHKAWLYHKRTWKKGIFVKMYRTRINGRMFTVQRKATPGFIRYWFATHKKKKTSGIRVHKYDGRYHNKGHFDLLSWLRSK